MLNIVVSTQQISHSVSQYQADNRIYMYYIILVFFNLFEL